MRYALLGIVMALAGATASAQTKTATGATEFGAGYTDVGPVIGLGGLGSASLSFGGRFEHGVQSLPDFGNGTLGIEVSADFYSYSTPNYSWKYVPIGATANYHFKLENTQFDPFVGLGLGYQIITCSYTGSGVNVCSNSDLYFIGRAGMRYFFQPNVSLYADVGAGAATLNIGVMFKVQ